MTPVRARWLKKYYLDAVKATKGTGIFPETLLAQAIAESSRENSRGEYEPGLSLNAQKANNYFGIKKYPKWKGRTIDLPTPNDAQKISTFVVYDSVLDSFAGYVKFLQVNPRYAEALKASSYPEQIAIIAAKGYAENKKYRSDLTQIANSIKDWASKFSEFSKASEAASNNTKNIFPLLFAAAVIAALVIFKHSKK
jgi:flagellum-specific peptidoglycan hydrolase FlgJ